jgi:hypothetical protein
VVERGGSSGSGRGVGGKMRRERERVVVVGKK